MMRRISWYARLRILVLVSVFACVLGLRADLLHAETVSRAGGKGLKNSLLVTRESCVEAFGALCEPAFGQEAIAVYEVV